MSNLSQVNKPEPKTVSAVLPQHTPSTQQSSTKRRVLLVGAIVLLVGAFVIQSMAPTFGGSSSTQGTDPDMLVDGALAGMDVSAQLNASQAIAAADAAVFEAQGEAQRTLDAAIDEANALADQVTGMPLSLRAPEGYVSGDDVSMLLGGVPTEPGFEVPDLPGEVPLQDLRGLTWSYTPAPIDGNESWIPEAGIDQLDAAKGQLDAAMDQLDGLLNQPEIDFIWTTLESQGLPSPRGAEDGVPATPEDLDDPRDTLEPDEESARLAQEHAERVLTLADARLGAFEDDLDKIDAAHDDLVGLVDYVHTIVPALQNETSLRLDDELHKRIGTILYDAEQAKLQVEDALANYESTLEQVRADATAKLLEDVDAEIEHLQTVSDEQAAYLLAHVDTLRGEADATIAQIESTRIEVLATLAEIEVETGNDLSRMMAIIDTAADATIAEVEAEMAQAEVVLREAANRILSDAENQASLLYERASDAKAELDARLDDAGAKATTARDFVVAHADAFADKRLGNVNAMKNHALETFNAAAEQHMDNVLQTAYEVNQDSQAILRDTDLLTDSIRDDLMEGVTSDVDTILEVAEDFATVPTPDRQQMADDLESAATDLSDRLVALADVGGATDDLLLLITFVQLEVDLVQDQLELRGAVPA